MLDGIETHGGGGVEARHRDKMEPQCMYTSLSERTPPRHTSERVLVDPGSSTRRG